MRKETTIGLGLVVTLALLSGCGSSDNPATGGGSDASPDVSLPDAGPTEDAGGGGDVMVAPETGSEAGPPAPKFANTPSHGSTVALTSDDSRLVVANHDVGTASIFSVDYSGMLPALTKVAELAVGAEPSAVAVHPNGDTAFVVSRKDQKLVKITGLKSTPTIPAGTAGTVSVGSEPTGLALTPAGTTVWVANWVDGTLMGFATDTLKLTTTIDLNAALAAAPYLGAGLTTRPSLAHPRAIAITNNNDMLENDETIYVTEFFAQQKTPLKSDGSNADTNWVGILYKIPLATKAVSLIEIPPMLDMGFQDHNGGTAGCFPNQINSINIQGGFGYVMSTCASPKSPLGVFNGPAAPACKAITAAAADATCPGGGAGSCGGLKIGVCAGTADAGAPVACLADGDCPGAVAGSCAGVVAGVCKTTCTTDTQCAPVGGKCGGVTPNVCDPNPSDVKTVTASVISIIDLGGSKSIGTVNLAKEFSNYYDVKAPYDQSAGALPAPLPDDTSRLFPLMPADIGFVPGTVTAYLPAYGADAVFRIDFNAQYSGKIIDSLGDPNKKHPFMSLFNLAFDPSQNGQLPSGVAVAHATHTMGSTVRYAFTNNERTRNVTVLDLSAQEIAGASANPPSLTTAVSSAPPTDQAEIDRLEGKRKFITGLGRWSWRGQAWQACASCHADGLTDNVSWYAGRGPRQSPNVDGSFVKGTWTGQKDHYRINSWEGVQDEIADHEGAIRTFSGGVGATVKDMGTTFASRLDVTGQTGLNGSSLAVADPANPEMLMTPSVLSDWNQIVAWGKTIRSPRRPSNLDPAKIAAGQALFTQANCQGCHGGPLWTASVVFYEPDPTGVTNNKLKTLSWTAAVQASGFPAALLPVASGLTTGTLPNIPGSSFKGQAVTYSGQTMRYSGNQASLFDQLTCAIRNVGTYGVAQAEAGIAELRSDLITPAQGNEPDAHGFNIPPLLNVMTGAPYFHAGNALSLEAVFSPTFKAHYQALAPTFLANDADPMRASQVASLIQFILSIDNDATPMAIPPLGPTGGVFCSAQ